MLACVACDAAAQREKGEGRRLLDEERRKGKSREGKEGAKAEDETRHMKENCLSNGSKKKQKK